MMFQGNIAPNVLNKMGGIINPVGFDSLPGGDENEQKQAMNIQMSCCEMEASACADGEPLLSNEYECMAFHKKKMDQRIKDSQRLGVPMIVSEFGDCYNSDACVMEINLVTESCDDNLVGWAYQQYKTFGNEFKNSTEEEYGNDEGFLSIGEEKPEQTIGLYNSKGEP